MDRTFRWIFATAMVVTGVASLQQGEIDSIASDMYITAEVLTNFEKSGEEHTVRIRLKNTGNEPIPNSGWKVYFHSFYMLYPNVFPKNRSVDNDVEHMRFSMIQGDLYAFEPLPGFLQMNPDATRVMVIPVQWWSVSRTDFMPNWYVTSSDDSGQPRILTSTQTLSYVQPFDEPKQWKRYDSDQYNPFTAQDRKNRLGVNDAKEALKMIIPTPKSIDVEEGAKISVDEQWRIYGSSQEEKALAALLSNKTSIPTTDTSSNAKVIQLSVSSQTGSTPEGYTIRIREQVIQLTGNDVSGLFYAVQSLCSLLIHYDNTDIPQMTIGDEPRFQYRGMHVDVARNFHRVEDLKRVMEVMAMYKLNKLHLHLSDDEGWRLEIPGLPELTQISSKRCHDLDEHTCIIPQYGSGPFDNTIGTGFFTIEDYKTILQFAKDNYIEIVPEFDMPGHAHAAIIAMENRYRTNMDAGKTTEAEKYRLKDPNDVSEYLSVQQWSDNAINPCIESTYTFISKVVEEVKKQHDAILPLKTYHFGGDEVASGAWGKSPKCTKFLQDNPIYDVDKGLKQYFAERVSDITAKNGVGMRGWEDGFMDGDGNPFPLNRMNNSDMSAQPWDNIWEWGVSQRAYRLANAGYKVVMSQATDMFFDQPQEPDPEERGLYWATRFTDTYKTFGFLPDSLYDNIEEKRSGESLSKADVCGADMSKCDQLNKPENIIGMQAQLWSETLRTSENMDYMLFPRLLALAERAWHKASFEAVGINPATREELLKEDWMKFANSLGYKELGRLDSLGVKYRVPPPGASIVDGKVKVSTTFPGLPVQYTRVSEPQWQDVTGDIDWKEDEKGFFVKTLSADRQRESREIQLIAEPDEPLPAVNQPVVDYIASHVTARIEVVDNLHKVDNAMTVRLNLTNTYNRDVQAGNWRIHLYSLYGFKVQKLSCGLRVGHVNGGLYFVTPSSATFNGLGAGNTLTCMLRNNWWTVTRTDQMPNWYVSAKGMKAKVIANTVDETLSFVGRFDSPVKWKRTKEDLYNPYTPSERYKMYKMETRQPDHWRIVPTPKTISGFDGNTVIRLSDGWNVLSSMDFVFESKFLADSLGLPLLHTRTSPKCITFNKASLNNESEAYVLDVHPPNTVTIKAEDGRGALHGVQSLISLVEGSPNSSIPELRVSDKPRFQYRGIMIDVARNFKPKEWLYKVLDVMSMYKLNKLHLHLSDDEGWRVEIPGLPELTQVGGRRCHTDEINACVVPALGSGPDSNTSGSGFYTVSDYRAILKYAADRHIDVIPEIDMPGHSSAAITSMFFRDGKIADLKAAGATNIPQSYTLSDSDMDNSVESVQKWRVNAMNPCIETSYNFVEMVVNGFISLHKGVMPLELFHIGGDEVAEGVWDRSEHCKHNSHIHEADHTYLLKKEFVTKVANILASRNLSLAAWEDGMYGHGKPNPISDYKRPVYVYTWSNAWSTDKAKRSSQFADAGYKVILPLATHLYLDHPYEPDPEERGLYWATRFTDTKKMFGFMPDHIWWNADVDQMGHQADLKKCDNKQCPHPKKPENIIGMQASLFSETVRNKDQLHYMLFPKILGLAERSWHSAPWEDIENKQSRDARKKSDWEEFATALGYKECIRLEKKMIKYRVPPPGGILAGRRLQVNTLYPNHDVELSLDSGITWTPVQHEYTVTTGTESVLLRSRSPYLRRASRVIDVKPTTVHVSAGSKVNSSLATVAIALLSFTLHLFSVL